MSTLIVELPEAGEVETSNRRGEYGKGYVERHGKGYRICFYDNQGRRRRKTYSTEAKANKALSDQLVLKEKGKLDAYETRITIDTLAELYLADRKGCSPKSYDWLKSVWDNHLEPFFGGYLAGRIATEKIIEYRNTRLDAEASPSSVNKEVGVLKWMFGHGLNDYDPPKVARMPKFPADLTEANPRGGFLTDEQYDLLQANCKHAWLKALLAVSFTYGFRRAELVGRPQRKQSPMLVSQIDLANRPINLEPGKTKSGHGRVVKMTQDVYNLLKPCIEGKRPTDPVFTWSNGRPVKDFRETWNQLTTAAGVPNLLLHDMRRTAARNLIRAGIDRDVAKKITGHRTDSMFSRYNIVSETDLMEAADKLNARRTMGANAGQQSPTTEISPKLTPTSNQNS